MLTESRPNPKQVIVSTEDENFPPVQGLCVHHSDFPELSTEGETARGGAAALVHRLTWALENAGDDWRRTRLETAIEDVKAFLDQGP